MFAPSALRSLIGGTPGLLLAALFLAARLLAASMTVAAPVQNPALDLDAQLSVFCHAGSGKDDPNKAPTPDHDCLVCPACHLMAHAGLPTPRPAALPTRIGGMIVLAALPPIAAVPPRQPRVAAHPTGPPRASI